MTEKFARLLKLPEMSSKTDDVLNKFDLALDQEIKDADFRSTFSGVQTSRSHNFKKEAMKKYLPENPWNRWTNELTRALLSHKSPSCLAEDPKKLATTVNLTQSVKIEQPRVAQKGCVQHFSFKAAAGKAANSLTTKSVKNA